MRGSSERAIEEAVIAGHIRSLQAEHLVDIPSSNQHSVKPWFQGRLDFAPAVPDLGDAGWTLVGGRLDYIAGRAVAAVVYRRRLHDINVFIWPKSGAADETAACEAISFFRARLLELSAERYTLDIDSTNTR